MPRNKQALIRYKTINKLLSNGKSATREQMAQVCSESLNNIPVSLRTIENDLRAMRYDEGLGYYAPIVYDHGRGAYVYDENGYDIDHLPLESDDIRKLKLAASLLKQYGEVNTFREFSGTIDKVVRLINYRKLQSDGRPLDFIEFEKNPTTTGMELIDPLIACIQNRQVIRIRHQSFWKSRPETFTVHPFYLKEYHGRWYLVGYCEQRKAIRIFGLERILGIEHLPLDKFTWHHFNPETYFGKFIGMNVPEKEPEDIILRFRNDVGKFIETQPLHQSQKLIASTGHSHDFSYFLAINWEFIGIVLSWQDNVEVLGPEGFREQIIGIVKKMGEMYGVK